MKNKNDKKPKADEKTAEKKSEQPMKKGHEDKKKSK